MSRKNSALRRHEFTPNLLLVSVQTVPHAQSNFARHWSHEAHTAFTQCSLPARHVISTAELGRYLAQCKNEIFTQFTWYGFNFAGATQKAGLQNTSRNNNITYNFNDKDNDILLEHLYTLPHIITYSYGNIYSLDITILCACIALRIHYKWI